MRAGLGRPGRPGRRRCRTACRHPVFRLARRCRARRFRAGRRPLNSRSVSQSQRIPTRRGRHELLAVSTGRRRASVGPAQDLLVRQSTLSNCVMSRSDYGGVAPTWKDTSRIVGEWGCRSERSTACRVRTGRGRRRYRQLREQFKCGPLSDHIEVAASYLLQRWRARRPRRGPSRAAAAEPGGSARPGSRAGPRAHARPASRRFRSATASSSRTAGLGREGAFRVS